MAWIEYHEELREHWKVQRLADVLGGEYIYALGAITCLWLWCAQYAKDGNLRRFTDDEIRTAGRTKSEKFSKKTLRECHLLDRRDRINDWEKHGLKLLESRRKANREYMKRKRSTGYPQDTQRMPIPYPTVPDQTRPDQTLPDQTTTKAVIEVKDLLANELFGNITETQKDVLCTEYPKDFLIDRLSRYIATAARNNICRMSSSRLFEWLEKDFRETRKVTGVDPISKTEARRLTLEKKLEEIPHEARNI